MSMGFRDMLKNAFKSSDDKKEDYNHEEANINPESPEKIESAVDREKYSDDENAVNQTPQIRSFEYLDDLIHSGKKRIVLDFDIKGGKRPNDGIKLDVDNIVIEGNGHIIDAESLSRIFEVTGSNIVVKALTLKNGKNHTDYGDSMNHEWRGGAVYAHESVTFVECSFIDNVAGTDINERAKAYFNFRAYGGAVYGKCIYVDCSFSGNLTKAEEVRDDNLNGDTIGRRFEFYDELKGRFLDMIEMEQRFFGESECFTYLNDLIKSGSNEIALSSDIAFDDSDKLNCSNIAIGTDGLIIDGNGHVIDAGGHECPFDVSGKNIELRNLVLRNFRGDVLSNNGEVKLTNVIFETNLGRICYNNGRMQIFDCVFKGNVSIDSSFVVNNDDLKVLDSEFLSNATSLSIVYNKAMFESHSNRFEDNISELSIFNDDGATCSIFSGNFLNNLNENSAICNYGKYCIIQKSVIENAGGLDIINMSRLTLESFDLSHNGKSILNEGYILMKNTLNDIENSIDNHGEIDIFEDLIPEGENFDFTYLDALIHKGNGQIVLENDISFEKYEKDFYEGGIELDVDGIVIDGSNNAIDAGKNSRIFVVTAKNVVLKNIIFKGGLSYSNPNNPLNGDGGALRICGNADVLIENCRFISNASEINAGAINNCGRAIIRDSIMDDNESGNHAGAIFNYGILEVSDTKFNKNHSSALGGAIHNDNGKVQIENCELISNRSDCGGGAYNSTGEIVIADSSFGKNSSKTAGALFNESGHITITHCKFAANNAYGAAAINNSKGLVEAVDTSFAENESKHAGAVQNMNGIIQFDHCIFKGNENTSTKYNAKYGGAISNVSGEAFIRNSTFEDNRSCYEYCDDCYNCGYLTLENSFFKNDEKTVFNERNMYLKSTEDLNAIVENAGNVLEDFPLGENQKPFAYLQDLIDEGACEITLEHDIVLDTYNNESVEFINGIVIDGDLTIDGNGHTIDARHRKRIFTVFNGDVTLANIHMKNGFCDNEGIVTNHAKLKIRNCTFTGNESKSSGVIENDRGYLTIEDCCLRHNDAHNLYTCNGGVVHVINSILSFGKCIMNLDSILKITGTEMNSNKGAINNHSFLEVSDCFFIRNESKFIGAMENHDDAYISNCIFRENKAYSGGAIENTGKLKVSDSIFDSNECEHMGGAINNSSVGAFYNLERDKDKFSQMVIVSCTFKNNRGNLGEAVYNSDDLTVVDSSFTNNLLSEKGLMEYQNNEYANPMKVAAIYSVNPDLFKISGCSFESNGHDVYNYKVHLR